MHAAAELLQCVQLVGGLTQSFLERGRGAGIVCKFFQLGAVIFCCQLHGDACLGKAALHLRGHGIEQCVRSVVQVGTAAHKLVHAVGQLVAAIRKGIQRILQIGAGLLSLCQIIQKIGVRHFAAVQLKGLQQGFQAVIGGTAAQTIGVGIALGLEGQPGCIQRFVIGRAHKAHTELLGINGGAGSFFKRSIVIRRTAGACNGKASAAQFQRAANGKAVNIGIVLLQQDLAGLHGAGTRGGYKQVDVLPALVNTHGGIVCLEVQRKILLQGHTGSFDLGDLRIGQGDEHTELTVLYKIFFIAACSTLNDGFGSAHQGDDHEHGKKHQKEQRCIPGQVVPEVPQDTAEKNLLHIKGPPAGQRACARRCGSSGGSGRP